MIYLTKSFIVISIYALYKILNLDNLLNEEGGFYEEKYPYNFDFA